MKKWVYYSQAQQNQLAEKEDDIICILLKNRNIITQKEKEDFFHPTLSVVTTESIGVKKKELSKAFSRLQKASKKKESVVVYADYDADGICAGAIFWETLYHLGFSVMPYVPDRIKEGYGLSKEGIDTIIDKFGTTLIITVDHGVSAKEEIAYAKKQGADVIVLDHHTMPKSPPNPFAMLHTTKLSAGGLSWVIAKSLCEYFRENIEEKMENSLELVAISTIADLMPLTEYNRILVFYGLQELNNSRRIGINALIKNAGIEKGRIGVYEVGHVIAPRINAMGRLSHGLEVLRLLCTNNTVRAKTLAEKLSYINRQRQLLTEESTQHAIHTLQEEFDGLVKKGKQLPKILLISHDSYQQGIIGLIAGKITEIYYRPSVVFSVGKEWTKASARSIVGCNIVKIIRQCEVYLENMGGHPMAAGFTIATKNMKKFISELRRIAESEIEEKLLMKRISIELCITFKSISAPFYKKLKTFEPFGIGNPRPIFASRNVQIVKISTVGKEKKHLKMLLRDHSRVVSAIGFGMGDAIQKLHEHDFVDVAYTIEENKWNGQVNLQLNLQDVNMFNGGSD